LPPIRNTLEKVVRAGSITRVAQGDPNVQTQISRQIAELEVYELPAGGESG
jgi:DNA-binding transcriptional LysR family regulator